jgi:hypothetical protein
MRARILTLLYSVLGLCPEHGKHMVQSNLSGSEVSAHLLQYKERMPLGLPLLTPPNEWPRKVG